MPVSGLCPFHITSSIKPALHGRALLLLGAAFGVNAWAAEDLGSVDVVVYGATPGGVTAAVAAARAGQDVVLVEPGAWIGGMMSGGLSSTDTGPRGPEVFGGLTAEFFRRVQDIERERGVCIGACEESYTFEPQVAARVFEDLLAEAGVRIERSAPITGVVMEGATLTSLRSARGDVNASVFIDASYEGDLMAMAGVPYAIGREPRVLAMPGDSAGLALQEDYAGIQPFQLPLNVHVDPYVIPGDAASGRIRYVEATPEPMYEHGEGDARVMAYTYRLCVTDEPANRVPFTQPAGYDAADYEAHARLAAAAPPTVNVARAVFNPRPVTLSPHDPQYNKYDLNGGFILSTAMTAPELNHSYLEATPEERARIRQAYRLYIEGLLYAWQTDPRFGPLNERVARFGHCADEFSDNGNWPHQMYVRTGRRMLGAYVMNENDAMQNGRRAPVEDSIGFGLYALDTHTHQYFVAPVEWPDGTRKDALVLEGIVFIDLPGDAPYPVSYRALTPREEDARNLLNPVTPSTTNIAYSSLRMEPSFMMLGEAAGTAAALSIERNTSVQGVSYPELRARLEANGQRVSLP